MSKFTARIQAELTRLGSDADVDLVETCMRCETPDLSILDETNFALAVKMGINNLRMDGTGQASQCLEKRMESERD
jgi:hypothetical protein